MKLYTPFSSLAILILASFLQHCSDTKKKAAINTDTKEAYYNIGDFNTVKKFDTHVHINVNDSTLIKEANRIEAGRNTANGPPEITQGMVNDAVVAQRHGLGVIQTNWWSKVLRILAAILSLIVGFMYDPIALQQQIYLVIFVLLIACAILTMTISILKE